MEKIKVLLFAANPPGTEHLDLNREFREIDEEIRYGEYRDRLDLIWIPGARPVDLLRRLNKERPQIVHFSGHGSDDVVFLEEEGENEQDTGARTLRSGRDMKGADSGTPPTVGPADVPGPVGHAGLAEVLKSCDAGNIKVVVLNACHTRSLADAIGETIDCVVSMDKEISDRSAIKFAASFYGALAFGLSIQTAFNQAVARLKVERTFEELTPTLLVREGVDAGKLVVLGSSSPGPVSEPHDRESPFTVPFPRNMNFVGRDQDLERLHASLAGQQPVGIRPSGLTGMGGIGKTQLAVEYAYRYRAMYVGGIYWINAAEPLFEGFAALGCRFRSQLTDRSRDEQVRAAFQELNRPSQVLVILDNLAEPSALNRPVAPGCIPSALLCHILFTTRRRDLGRFGQVEVTVLPEESALRLLLRHPDRQSILDPVHPDHEDARAICRMLGRLPLALELAGAFLGEWGDIRLNDYRERLKCEGLLATLDDEAAELPAIHLPAIHDAAVTATLSSQWDALQDETARRLLRVAAQLPEAVSIPVARLGLLAGVSIQQRLGNPSPLARALKRLGTACLVEDLYEDRLRLHPLVSEFAVQKTPLSETPGFRLRCASAVINAYSNFASLEEQALKRGIDAVEEDIAIALDFCKGSGEPQSRAEFLLRLVRREGGNLRCWDSGSIPSFFPQQIHNRAVLMGADFLKVGAHQRLSTLRHPYLNLCWRASCESEALIRSLLGHQGEINQLVITPDGRQILSASVDGSLKLWDLDYGRELRTFSGHKDRINDVVLTPDGRKILSASSDHSLKLWDLQSGQLLHTFQAHEDWVTAVALAPDSSIAVSGSEDYSILMWSLDTGQLLGMLGGHQGGVRVVRISSDSRRALTASVAIKLWDLCERRELATMQGHSDWVNDLLFLPDERFALSASSDGTLRLWDLHEEEQVRRMDCGKEGVNLVTLCPDGRRALAATSDGLLQLWDVLSGQLIREFAGHHSKVSTIAITPDGRRALTALANCTIKIWDLEDVGECHIVGQGEERHLVGHEDRIFSVKLTLDGRHAVSSSADRTIKLWDLSAEFAGETGLKWGHVGSVRNIVITADGRKAFSCGLDRTSLLWDVRTGAVLQSLYDPFSWVRAIALSADGNWALSGAAHGRLLLWDLATGRIVRRFKGHQGVINTIQLTSNGDWAISGSSDKSIRVWKFATGEKVHVMTGHESGVKHLALTPDERRLVSASGDGSIRVWDLQNGREQQSLDAHERSINALSLTPDGHCVVSASSDGTLKVWRFNEERAPVTLVGHSNRVNDVVVLPDGLLALSAASDATLRLWDLLSGNEIRVFTGHQGWVWSVRLTGDACYACTTSFDRELRVWDLQTGSCLARVPIEGSPTCLAIAKSEPRILVGGGNGNVSCFTLTTEYS